MSTHSSKILADLIITPGWIVTMTAPRTVLTECSVVICNGIIDAILPNAEAQLHYAAKNEYLLPDSILMPGLINTHCHGAMTLFRGLADDLPLQKWLEDYIWPAEERWVSEEFVSDGTDLAIAEMLLNGITCFADMYFFPDQIAASIRKSGIRAQVSFPVLDFPSAWARNADEYIHKGLELYDEYSSDALTDIAFGPHATYTVSDDALHKIFALAGELEAAIQIHLHETEIEVAGAVAKDGLRPLDKLLDFGGLSTLTQCVHMTQLNDSDIDILGRTGAHVLHCPRSNMKLASGFCPTNKLIAADINVALGTDGSASNNGLNLFAEMNMAALINKGLSGDPEVINAEQALRLATINGAKALGLAEKTGSIEVSKAADLIAIDMSNIASQPLYNPLSHLVYTDCARQVSHVWVNGELLVNEGQLTTLDRKDLLARASYWQTKINRG
jgi:5-methylthioadenosine/S-adenosylhomocysteine deaminase